MMDNSDVFYKIRTKEKMLRTVIDALDKGIYPGWKDEAKRNNDNRIPSNRLPESDLCPVPLRTVNKKTGDCVIGSGRKALACRKTGRNMIVTFWDTMTGVDLHKLVYFFLSILFMTTTVYATTALHTN
jgi:hypothetical protein